MYMSVRFISWLAKGLPCLASHNLLVQFLSLRHTLLLGSLLRDVVNVLGNDGAGVRLVRRELGRDGIGRVNYLLSEARGL